MNPRIEALRLAAERAHEQLQAAEAELAQAIRMAPVEAAMEAEDDDLVDRLLDQMEQDAEDFADVPDHAYNVIHCNEHGEPIGWC